MSLKKTVLEYIQGKNYNPLNETQLLEKLALPSSKKQVLETVLGSLIKAKKITRNNQGLFFIKRDTQTTYEGILHKSRRGFGFVEVEELSQDVFIPKHEMFGALDQDSVLSRHPQEKKVRGLKERLFQL